MRARHVLTALGLTGALALTACGNDDHSEGSGADSQTLTVFAAASLTATFEELERQFENAHPDVDVRLSFGGSSDLVAQIAEGAGADVFAAADTVTMNDLVEADLTAGEPVEFATNTLEIVVPPGNPGGVSGLGDLGDPDLALVVCAPEVPCGSASTKVADLAGITLAPDSEESSVTDVLAKVSSGEADAGLVYATDVLAAGDDVEGIAFEEAAEVVNHYPIVAVADRTETTGTDLAAEWIELVTGAGQAVLADAGFGAPAP